MWEDIGNPYTADFTDTMTLETLRRTNIAEGYLRREESG